MNDIEQSAKDRLIENIAEIIYDYDFPPKQNESAEYRRRACWYRYCNHPGFNRVVRGLACLFMNVNSMIGGASDREKIVMMNDMIKMEFARRPIPQDYAIFGKP